MDTSDWPLSTSGALDKHLRRLSHLVDLAKRDGRESPWYAVYSHVLTFMAARNETDEDPLYVWPQCSMYAKVTKQQDAEEQPQPAGELRLLLWS